MNDNPGIIEEAVIPESTSRSHRKMVWLTFAIAAATILADQLTKIWALSALADGHRIPILGEYLSLRLMRNPGAALGIGYGFTWVLTIFIAIFLIILLTWIIPKIASRGWAWAFGLLLGGALGNFIDRIFRYPGFAHGKVIDFIAYWNWFVGNVADIAIVVAAGLIILLTFRGIHIDGTRDSDRPSDESSPRHPAAGETKTRHPAADEVGSQDLLSADSRTNPEDFTA